MNEEWVTLIDFPAYEINMAGEIVNRGTGRKMSTSVNQQGIIKVGLVRNGKQHTRSIATLVAKVFVPGRNDIFDYVIHLDGDLSNCHMDNLMWRPKWFAYVYHRQFSDPAQRAVCLDDIGLYGPIYDVRDGMRYENVLEASVTNGLLIRDVFYRTMDENGNNQIWPTGQEFHLPGFGSDRARQREEKWLKEEQGV